MFGQPEPTHPVFGSEPSPTGPPSVCVRDNYVSLWTGAFESVERAEAYFGIPDEIGVYLPPEAFAADFDLGNFPPENLEVHFEQMEPRPLPELLDDVTFSVSFRDLALAAASGLGIHQAQGVALIYRFDYRLDPAPINSAGPMRFVGSFPFLPVGPQPALQVAEAVARATGYPLGAVLLVAITFKELCAQQRKAQGFHTHFSAREYCDHLQSWRGPDTPAVLRDLGLRRSEDVGRIVYGMIEAGLAAPGHSDSEADFAELFRLE